MRMTQVTPFRRLRTDTGQATLPGTAREILHTLLGVLLCGARILTGITPFGAAFYGAVFSMRRWIGPYLSMVLGTLITHHSAGAIPYIAAASLFTVVQAVSNPTGNRTFRAVTMGLSLMAVHLIGALWNGFLLYDVLIALCDSFLCTVGVLVLDGALPLLSPQTGIRTRRHISTEEMIGITVLLSLAILGLSGIPAAFGLKISRILSILLVLMFSLNGTLGTAAATGTIIGLVNSVDTYNAGAVVGAYSFSALMASLFKRFGKLGVTLGFILSNAIITIFLNGSTEVLINIYETLFAALLLFVLPPEATSFFSDFSEKASVVSSTWAQEEEYAHHPMQEKLHHTADAFSAISQVYHRLNLSPEQRENTEAMELFNRTAALSCANCSLKYCCWQKNLKSTYHSLFAMLAIAQERGSLEKHGIPQAFSDKCNKPDKFLSAFNHQFELYRQRKVWENKLSECRALVSEQMTGVAHVIDMLAEQLNAQTDNELECQIRVALDREGIQAQRILATQKNGRLSIELLFSHDAYTTDLEYHILPLLERVTDCEMTLQRVREQKHRTLALSYAPCDRFSAETGVACTKKQGEEVNGDSFTTISLPDGSFAAAISDGMGCGKTAAEESRTTIALLEQFLDAGFEKETAIRLINSSLLLQTSGELFSTLDLCAVNLHRGIAEFIKVGAAATYLKTSGSVEEISAPTLPVGVFREVQMEKCIRRLEEETLVVMLSDGIADAGGNGWVAEALRTLDTSNPQTISDRLLEEAILRSGNGAFDDMTVLTLRIWKV
ncbi:MAG: stage II sporulation protein E [Ruminococcaceae bacterium]|nr:stage II sporulation protein E [Oscillospiraceae bacterium]